jgi:transcriptional regulator with XRE-family HTH domain
MTLDSFLEGVMRRRRLLPSQLAKKIGVSHASMSRWLSGKDLPSPKSCRKLAEYEGLPPEKVLAIAGYIPQAPAGAYVDLPEFSEYARMKYSAELDEDVIIMIEDLIGRRKAKKGK